MSHSSDTLDRSPAQSRFRSVAIRIDHYLRIFVVGVMLIAAVGAGIVIDRYAIQDTPVGAQTQDDLTDVDEFGILEETYRIIRDDYVMSEDISDEELIYGASRGMVDALGDEGHSRFLDPEEARAFEESSRGELVGIGIQVDTSQVPLRVIMPIQNSPAAEAGIRSGDVILTIDGADVSEIENPEEAFVLLRGEEGTEVTLELRHEGEAETYEVTLTRRRITVESVSWAMMPGNVLWVRISEFSQGTTDGLEAALQEGKSLGAQGVILDLRANPGGLVFEAIGVGSQLQPDDSVLYQEENADGEIQEVTTVGSRGEWQEGPLVVLIDGDSASAAEITSSSIADNGRGTLIGETTFGTGTVLLPMELEDGSMVLIGTEMWLTASGEVIWHQGVEPQIEVENEPGVQISLPYSFEANQVTETQFGALEDDQLLAAYEEITKQIEEAGN